MATRRPSPTFDMASSLGTRHGPTRRCPLREHVGMSDQNQIGLTGLAVMGANLARNIARHGYSIAVHNRTPAKTRDFVAEFGDEGAITGTETIEEFVAALERPRKIIIMVKAGAPVDADIDELSPHLDEGDIVIDAGNSHFHDTKRRAEACAARGLRFLGTGVS